MVKQLRKRVLPADDATIPSTGVCEPPAKRSPGGGGCGAVSHHNSGINLVAIAWLKEQKQLISRYEKIIQSVCDDCKQEFVVECSVCGMYWPTVSSCECKWDDCEDCQRDAEEYGRFVDHCDKCGCGHCETCSCGGGDDDDNSAGTATTMEA